MKFTISEMRLSTNKRRMSGKMLSEYKFSSLIFLSIENFNEAF